MGFTAGRFSGWYRSVIIILGISGYVLSHGALACSSLLLPNSEERVMGKSYDWSQGHGMLVVNKRGVHKQSFIMLPGDKRATWRSTYGSVSFTQHGREFPVSGINEKGLAIEVLWLDSSVYPRPDDRPTVNEVQWVQYQLDNYASVAEMIEHKDDLRISPVYAKVHYFACDALGECATFEVIDREMVVHSGDRLPLPLLTNDTYDRSLAELSKYAGFGGNLPIPQSTQSLHRFVRAASLASTWTPGGESSAVDVMFSILSSVGPYSVSQFHIVYELAAGSVRFRTRQAREIKSLELGRLDYACDSWNTELVDMNTEAPGDVLDRMVPYSREINAANIKESLSLVGSAIPQSVVDHWIKYPESLPCRP